MAEKIKSWKSDESLIRAQVAHGCIRKPKTKNRTSRSLRNQQRYIVPKQWTGFLAISVKKGWSKFTADVCVCWRFLMRHGVSGQIT